MSKPEFSRPFDLDYAKAGASYCCRDGRPAQVLKWDRNVSDYPLLGIIGKSDDPRTWAITGSTTYGNHGEEYDCDLVMLPLGFIDGKPVFVGDEFEQFHSRVGGWIKQNATPKCGEIDFSKARWPAPALMYPETLIPHSAMFDEYSKSLYGMGYIKIKAESQGLAAVANAALRHAIDSGQVVLPSEFDAAVRPYNPHTGRRRDQRDIESDPMGKLLFIEPVQPSVAPSDDLLMKVAKAVMIEMRGLGGMAVYGFNENNCKSIIASVTGTKDAKERAQ